MYDLFILLSRWWDRIRFSKVCITGYVLVLPETESISNLPLYWGVKTTFHQDPSSDLEVLPNPLYSLMTYRSRLLEWLGWSGFRPTASHNKGTIGKIPDRTPIIRLDYHHYCEMQLHYRLPLLSCAILNPLPSNVYFSIYIYEGLQWAYTHNLM